MLFHGLLVFWQHLQPKINWKKAPTFAKCKGPEEMKETTETMLKNEKRITMNIMNSCCSPQAVAEIFS